MGDSKTLDNWLLIPIGNKDCIFGQLIGTRNFLVTSEVVNIDGMNPPAWATTKSGSQYKLATRDSTINRYSSAAVFDTLSKRGFSPEQIASALDAACRINEECQSGATISLVFNKRRQEKTAAPSDVTIAAPDAAAAASSSDVTIDFSNQDQTCDVFAEARRLAAEMGGN